ncbi:MAG: enoyl-CoA hydratase-related protein [Pigmentiphaga sp.]|uniref:enoyl-CoA hydratase/isomerase family protein n=1 Tax=Pigmentiphaga sp. TaxID=1977564 RepID=UPI0029AD99BD|nr:enoyl-CoA hydratase-related protein [Pigmentiphaga sp.]MDX3905698.1 enoyl-CoA hydratase-related protein [Pigmentiphaga sp.]
MGKRAASEPATRATDSPPSAGRIEVVREGAVLTLTLAHPGKLNALTVAMWQALEAAMRSAADERGLRAVVIRGADGHFAAGADISEFPKARGSRAAVRHYHEQVIAPALRAVARCPLPTLAVIQGVCVGGGLEIACCCDLRIAARTARIGAPIGRLGFPMAPAELAGLLAVAGRAVALELLLEGRIIEAPEAYAKGLLTRVVDDAGLEAEAGRTLQRIAGGAPLAATLNKRMVRRLARPEPLDEAELDAFFSYSDTRDHREGVAAFLEGRTPEFDADASFSLNEDDR